jgi:hypothetical protein
MKWLVWFLVLFNLGSLAYFNMDVIAPKPIPAHKSISPEKLKVLTERELEALPKKVAEMPAQLCKRIWKASSGCNINKLL